MRNKHTKLVILAALFTALVVVCTRFLQIPVLSNGGYIHFGDAIIILAAVIFPKSYAACIGAIGGGIADLTVAPAWAPWTIVIKALIALCFSSKQDKLLTKRNAIALLPAALITVVGYYFAEVFICQNWVAPFLSVWGNAVQAIGSSVIYIVVAVALDKANFKKSILSL